MSINNTKTKHMKAQKLIFEVVGLDNNQLEQFKGTQQQAQLYWSAKYDTDHTILKQVELLDLSTIKFEGEQDECYAINPNTDEVAFRFCQDPKSAVFFRIDEDGECAEQIGWMDLEAFPNFIPLVVCTSCDGSGVKDGAAKDCGTRFYGEACDCESVIFES